MPASTSRIRMLGHEAPCRIDEARSLIPVVVPHPVAHAVVGAILVPALRRQVEIHISRVHHFISASKSGIRMEYLAPCVLVEHTQTRPFLADEVANFVVVGNPPGRNFLWLERRLVVVVEITAIRRKPQETPTHTFLETLNFIQRSPRDRDQRNIMMLEVHQGPLHMMQIVFSVAPQGDQRSAPGSRSRRRAH
jgi:hypothetical protein